MRPVREERAVIKLDLDRDRIRSIVGTAYDFVTDYLSVPLYKSREDIMATLETILATDRISTMFFLDFSNRKMDDFQLRVDPRRREVLGIAVRQVKLKNNINAYLRTL